MSKTVDKAFARHVFLNLSAHAKKLGTRVKELEERLEVDPAHPYDGIACRDETIRQQDLRVARLEARVKQLERLLKDVIDYPGNEHARARARAALNPSQEPA